MIEWTREHQKEHRKLWVQALRSGMYQQGKFVLKANNGDMCCLGVLSEIAGCEWSPGCVSWGADGHHSSAPQRAIDFVGLSDRYGSYSGCESLQKLNDRGATFSEIADLIESEPKDLFVKPLRDITP